MTPSQKQAIISDYINGKPVKQIAIERKISESCVRDKVGYKRRKMQ